MRERKRPRQYKIIEKQDDYNERNEEINNHYIYEPTIQKNGR